MITLRARVRLKSDLTQASEIAAAAETYGDAYDSLREQAEGGGWQMLHVLRDDPEEPT